MKIVHYWGIQNYSKPNITRTLSALYVYSKLLLLVLYNNKFWSYITLNQLWLEINLKVNVNNNYNSMEAWAC